MSTQQLLALNLLVVVLSAVMFFAAGAVTLTARSGRGSVLAASICAAIGVLTTVGHIAVVLLLVTRGWWFSGDKLFVALPLAVVTAAVAGFTALPYLVRRASGPAESSPDDGRGERARAGAALLIAGYGAFAGVLITFVVGYPVSIPAAITVVAVVAGVSGLTWVGLTGRKSRGLTTGLILLCLVPLLGTAALAFYTNLQPAVIGGNTGHVHLAAGPPAGATSAVGEDQAISVADLRTPADPNRPLRSFTVVASQQQVTLPSGRTVAAWTFGSLPGPEIRVRQGDLVEITLQNKDIADGVTLHWHGYPVPNGEDGVAGVTQDAIAPGESFAYRFVARDSGTYWYHTHQVGSEAVGRGLFGTLIVDPAPDDSKPPVTDLVLPIHTIEGITMIGGTDQLLEQPSRPGEPIRLRLINTDSTPHRISITGAAYTLVAVDGTDLNAPPEVDGQVLRLPAGGRYDVMMVTGDVQVSLAVEGAPDTGVTLGVTGSGSPPVFVDAPDLDLLSYGAPLTVPAMSDTQPDVEAELVLDRQLRFLGGLPTFAQTINGDVHPFVPPIAVREGQLLRLTVVNRGGDTHPMHPHGHRVLVESRDGRPVTGSPLWLDTFDVQPGEVWQVLLRADNPGIWMAHCHNLEHATQGMVVHLNYDGVRTPFTLGGGTTDNRPE